MLELIYGKDNTKRIVSIVPNAREHHTCIYTQDEQGKINSTMVPNSYWILYTEQHSSKMLPLKGDQPYKYIIEYDNLDKYIQVRKSTRDKRLDHYTPRDYKEMYMIKSGATYFKDMKVKDVTVLSFDIETTGLTHNKDAKVLIIANCYRDHRGNVTRKLFSLDEYKSQAEMLDAWCSWVREVNPSILLGHNLFGFDIPYLDYVAKRNGTGLSLGRDGSIIRFDKRPSKFRKDGSQAYDYLNCEVMGREIVDTFFLSIKYDIARNFPSYSLKEIIRHLGLEKKGRQHYDASTIKVMWNDLKEREKIKKYAIDDSDDALKLYDLMIPSFFYYTQSIPRSLQHVINTATGSQINSLMVRSYLQSGHSVAKDSPNADYEGAISFSIPGVHKNVLKLDVASLYPSIMLSKKIYDKDKDPKAHLLKILDYFRNERLVNKQKAKETKDKYYSDLEQSQKILINSMSGFMGAPRLNYNYPSGAAEVTRTGREILKKSIKLLTNKEYQVENNLEDEAV